MRTAAVRGRPAPRGQRRIWIGGAGDHTEAGTGGGQVRCSPAEIPAPDASLHANLDGDLWRAVASSGTDRPVLFVGNDLRLAHPDVEIDRVLTRSPRGVRRGLAGMAHGNFGDLVV